MSSKDVRNAIIALIMLAIGAWLLLRVGKVFQPKDSPIDFGYIMASIEGVLNIFFIGIVVIIIILIPVWIAKKMQERKSKNTGTETFHSQE